MWLMLVQKSLLTQGAVIFLGLAYIEAFPCLAVKNLPALQETRGSISGSGRSPGEGNGYPFQYSCWKNPLDRGSWWVSISKLCPGSGQTLTLRSADQKPPGKGFQWWAESRFQAGSVQLLHQWLRSAGGKTFHEESGRKYLWLCRPLGLCHTYLCLVSMHVSRLRRSLNDCTWLYSNKTL